MSNVIEIAGFKAAVVPQRVEVKDYLDIFAVLKATDITLIDMLASAATLFGAQFNPMITLQALSDLDNPGISSLPVPAKRTIRKAVAELEPASLLAHMRKANIKPR